MMSSNNNQFEGFTKSNIDAYLNELGKELRKEFGRDAKIEIIVIGGGAILINYNFRESTQDIDFFSSTRTSIKNAVNRTGDKLNLPNGWLNSDFIYTKSYSPKLIEHSKYYRTFSNVLCVRTITAEYLIAMKLASLREYKNDRSDIIGILQSEKNTLLSESKIIEAYKELYNTPLSKKQQEFLHAAFCNNITYNEIKAYELSNKRMLQKFETDYKNVLNENNISEVLQGLSKHKKKDSASKEIEAHDEYER